MNLSEEPPKADGILAMSLHSIFLSSGKILLW